MSLTSPSRKPPNRGFPFRAFLPSINIFTEGMSSIMIRKDESIPTAAITPNCKINPMGDDMFDMNATTVVKVASSSAIPTEPVIPLSASSTLAPLYISSR